MIMNVGMGLRADEARAILEKNGYTQPTYAYASNATNDGTGILYGISTVFGALLAGAVEQSINCSPVWINDPSCENYKPNFITNMVGAILGLGIPFYFLTRADQKEISEAERIGKLRNSVMKIIDDNYQDCNFHRPLKGDHIFELLWLTDEFKDKNTQHQLLERINQVQACQARKNISSKEIDKKLQDKEKPSSSDCLSKADWIKNTESELQAWCNLKNSLKTSDSLKFKNEIELRSAYGVCKNLFENKTVDTFVERHITDENFKMVGKLSNELKEEAKSYYIRNKNRIDNAAYFNLHFKDD